MYRYGRGIDEDRTPATGRWAGLRGGSQVKSAEQGMYGVRFFTELYRGREASSALSASQLAEMRCAAVRAR